MIRVGCCGFAKGMSAYFKEFKTIEIQQTFYKIPKLATLRKWREIAPRDFTFNVKCFQGVTHTSSSPTWRRYGEIKEGNPRNYGGLRRTREVIKSWEATLEACKTLGAEVCVIQTPLNFKDTEDNVKNAESFFSSVKRDGLKIAVELRGWDDENVKKLCKRFDLIDCRDPFASMPTWLGSEKVAYFRLHGSPPGKSMYKYKYTKEDLRILKRKIYEVNARKAFCMFNNVYMWDDALEFAKMVV